MDAHNVCGGLHVIYHDKEGHEYQGTIVSTIDKWTVWIKLNQKIDNLIDRIICPISQIENDRFLNSNDDRDTYCVKHQLVH